MKRGLGARLEALRRLPPGVKALRPEEPEAAALVDDLLSLPEAVKAVDWLREERSTLVSSRTLRYVLSQLRREYEQALRPQRKDLHQLPPWAQAIRSDSVAAWTSLSDTNDPFAGLDTADAEELRAILQRVRKIRPRYAGPSGTMPSGDLPPLIDDLLRLPERVDPIEWLRVQRGEWSAIQVLEGVLAAMTPPSPPPEEPLFRTSPKDKVVFAGRAEFTLDEFTLSRHGFTVEVTIRTFPENVPRPPEVSLVVPLWQGFDQVYDDVGYRFLFASGGPTTGDDRGRGDFSRFHASYFPSPPAPATELIFSSRPARLSVLGPAEGGRTLTLPDIELGDLEWRVQLPKSALKP